MSFVHFERRFTQLGASRDARRTANAQPRRGRPRGSYELGRQRREVLDLLLAGDGQHHRWARLGAGGAHRQNRIAEIRDCMVAP